MEIESVNWRGNATSVTLRPSEENGFFVADTGAASPAEKVVGDSIKLSGISVQHAHEFNRGDSTNLDHYISQAKDQSSEFTIKEGRVSFPYSYGSIVVRGTIQEAVPYSPPTRFIERLRQLRHKLFSQDPLPNRKEAKPFRIID